MSDTLPNEVREAMRKSISQFYAGATGEGEAFIAYSADTILDAALSALEAAGWEVNRKGTREALEAAARPLIQRLDDLEVEAGGVVPRLLQTAHVYIADLRGLRAALLTASNPKEKPMGSPQEKADV